MRHDRNHRPKTSGGTAAIAIAGGLIAASTNQAMAQVEPGPPASPQRSVVPDGFEDLDTSVETVFDVYYQGMRVASAPGRLQDGVFTFGAPDLLANKLPDADRDKATSFLSGPLRSNEQFRCPPGEAIDCGVLPSGVSGVIVDADRFRVDLFLGREMLLGSDTIQRIGQPVSGPSLIQGIGASISGNNQTDSLRLGLELSTTASIGRTSFVSRIYGDDDRGLQADEAYVQYYGDDQRYAGGLFNTEGTLALTTMRVAGARLSSFYGGYVGGESQFAATAVEVVLPRPARVEIYRDGVLMSSAQYPGGLQYLDTSRLPEGSYPIRVVVRDASGVILDEVRSFTRASDLPPAGKTVYSFTAGVRVADNFSAVGVSEDAASFLPQSTDELVIAGSVKHLVAPGFAVGASLTSVGDDLYPEASAQLYHGTGRGFASFAMGPEEQYAGVVGGGFQIGSVNTTIDIRAVKASPAPADPAERFSKYRPFLRDERSLNATVQAPFYDGFFSVRAAYGQFSELADRHFAGVAYTKPAALGWLGNGLFRFEASVSDADARVGFKFTLNERIDSVSMRTSALGAEYISPRENGGGTRSGVFPVAQLGYSREFELSDTQLTASGLAGIAEGEVGAQGALQAQSGLGEADLSVGASRSSETDRTDLFLTGNLRTGFVYGDGSLHFGRAGYGDAAVLVEIDEEASHGAQDGRFQIVVDGLPLDRLRVGQRTAISLPAFTQPRISLSPDAAPPFEIDLSPRQAPLYPGNVVALSWNAIRVVTAYGRLVDETGKPMEGIFVAAGNDIAMTGPGGYFAVTAPVGSKLSARIKGVERCPELAVLPEPGDNKQRAVANLGSLVCRSPESAAIHDVALAIDAAFNEPIMVAAAQSAVAETDKNGVLGRIIAKSNAGTANPASVGR